jgi:hypothetical protein
MLDNAWFSRRKWRFAGNSGLFLENLGEYAFLLNERKNRSDQVQWQANPRMAGRWRSCAPDMRCEKLRSENWDLSMKQRSPVSVH